MKPSKKGKEQRRRIYQYILAYSRQYGAPPTRREIQMVIGVKSVSTVTYHLAILKEFGVIDFRLGIDGGRTARNIVVLDPDLIYDEDDTL